MPSSRYVVLRHELPPHAARSSHWDLMLEDGERLLTWALAAEPDTASTIAAEALADHRLSYLNYEGPVSGDRGQVSKWDAGTFAWLRREPSRLQVHLLGQRLVGNLTLCLDAIADQRWSCVFTPLDSARRD